MAFAFENPGPSGHGGGKAPAELGPELPEVMTTEVGFKGVDRDCRIRFLPTAWPADALPPPTCSLMTVASRRGIIAAGSPQSLVVATTKSVREAISAEFGDGGKVKPFEPQVKVPLQGRPMQIASCYDENALAVSMEEDNQLLVYEITALLQGSTRPKLSLPTNGASLRMLAPNPSSEVANSALIAMVTIRGELLIGDISRGSLISGPSGPVLKDGVSCVSWSNKGKQLIAGLGDATCYQMTPAGVKKDEIPRPPDLDDNQHVSSIAWLEDHLFLIIYTPNDAEDDMGSIPPSNYYIVQRRQQTQFLFRKLPEICVPFGVKRTPAYQFISRLRDYRPSLMDALIVSSTASTDVGLITRLEQSAEARGIFASTVVTEDTRTATLPMNEGAETSTIGLGIDFSATETVMSPILGEDVNQTSTPLPNIILLNSDGFLLSWWFIYAESIRQNTPYHALSILKQAQQQERRLSSPAAGTPSQQSSSTGQLTFREPTAPSFGIPSALSSARQVAFGAPSVPGGSSILGSTATANPAPGGANVLAQHTPQFGKPGLGGIPSSGPSFGQPSTLGSGFSAFASGSTGFANAAAASTRTGFGTFAGSGGFGGLVASTPAEGIFSKPGPSIINAKTDSTTSPDTVQQGDSTGMFGLGSSGFVLTPGFKHEVVTAHDEVKPDQSASIFSMGSSFDDMVSSPSSKSPLMDAMDDMEDEPTVSKPTKPFAVPTSSLFQGSGKISAPSATTESLLGIRSQTDAVSGTSEPSERAPPFENGYAGRAQSSPLSPQSEKTMVSGSAEGNQSSSSQTTHASGIPEPPLPPNPTSKVSYGPGDTSASSNVSKSSAEDIPLPPDFSQPKENAVSSQPKEAALPSGSQANPSETAAPSKGSVGDDAPLPPDFLTTSKKTTSSLKHPAQEVTPSLDHRKPKGQVGRKERVVALHSEPDGSEGDFEDSGEEITHDISPSSEHADIEFRSNKTTPESSFGVKSQTGGFTTISIPSKEQPRRPLFGEITYPIIPASKPRGGVPSPSSPSPVRRDLWKGRLRPENSRSISAPGGPESPLTSARSLQIAPVKKEEVPSPKNATEESRTTTTELTLTNPDAQSLSEEEDEKLRAYLIKPISPSSTLDPFNFRRDHTGPTFKPGIPGQIERLCRDINSMIDTLGINSRSLTSYLLYQESAGEASFDKWVKILEGERPSNVLDEKLLFADMSKLNNSVDVLDHVIQRQRLQGAQEKLDQCQQLLSRDVFVLRGRCASTRKIIDAHTDSIAVVSAPLSSEQANLQQDLRKSSGIVQSKLAELEQDVSLLHAKIADNLRPNGLANYSISTRHVTKKPTVEAVTSTIATMMSMAESRSGDIDVLEAQMKKLGLSVSGGRGSREGSPFTTPLKQSIGRLAATPGSRTSREDSPVNAYHTPKLTNPHQSTVGGSVRTRPLRGVPGGGSTVLQEGARWQPKAHRRKEILSSLRRVIEAKKVRVRGLEES